MLESIFAKESFQPAALPPPKPSPRGEGGPAKPGRMRGRFGTQPFLVEKGVTDSRPDRLLLLPRWATRSPPHPSPSVTASPQGEAFVGGMTPQRKAFSPNPCSRKMRIQIRARRWAPKQPLYRNNAPPNPKTSECQRAGHKTGGPGGLPPALFPPVSREKRGPPPGRRPTGRCAPRLRKSPDHPKGTQYRPPPPRRGLFLPKALDKGSLIG